MMSRFPFPLGASFGADSPSCQALATVWCWLSVLPSLGNRVMLTLRLAKPWQPCDADSPSCQALATVWCWLSVLPSLGNRVMLVAPSFVKVHNWYTGTSIFPNGLQVLCSGSNHIMPLIQLTFVCPLCVAEAHLLQQSPQTCHWHWREVINVFSAVIQQFPDSWQFFSQKERPNPLAYCWLGELVNLQRKGSAALSCWLTGTIADIEHCPTRNAASSGSSLGSVPSVQFPAAILLLQEKSMDIIDYCGFGRCHIWSATRHRAVKYPSALFKRARSKRMPQRSASKSCKAIHPRGPVKRFPRDVTWSLGSRECTRVWRTFWPPIMSKHAAYCIMSKHAAYCIMSISLLYYEQTCSLLYYEQ